MLQILKYRKMWWALRRIKRRSLHWLKQDIWLNQCMLVCLSWLSGCAVTEAVKGSNDYYIVACYLPAMGYIIFNSVKMIKNLDQEQKSMEQDWKNMERIAKEWAENND